MPEKLPFADPSSMDDFMQQYFPSGPPPVVPKKELEEVDDNMDGMAELRHEYSPEDNAATSSERDESPDTVSNSPDQSEEDQRLSLQEELQKQVLRLQESLMGSFDGMVSGEMKPGSKIDGLAEKLGNVQTTPSSLLSSFNPQLALSAFAMQLAGGGGGSSPMIGGQHHQSVDVHTPSYPPPSSQLPSSLSAALQAQSTQLQNQSISSIHKDHQMSVGTTPTGYAQSPKRKRQRRNPVWPYFIVEEGIAKCKQCAYSTRSVFSTNLKVHLRSHHRSDYEKVIEAEDQLNLNALLLSGNAAAGLMGRDARKRTLPPMTSSILMTISKLAAAGQTNALQAALGGVKQEESMNGMNEQSNAVNVLRQTLANSQLQQQMNKNGGSPEMSSNLANMAALVRQQQQDLLQHSSQSPSIPSQSTPHTPSPVPTPQGPSTPDSFLSQLSGFAAFQNGGGMGGLDLPQPKRRRLRRHPVWMFFRDLEDRMVGCINCNFRTGSAFSTNLKMHLKAHHKDDYSKVLKLEDEMRIEEGIFGAPNKIKTELIDFIRGGGNASTPVQPGLSSAPTPSPLVQQLIAGNFSTNDGSAPQTPSSPQSLRVPSITINNNSTPNIKTEEESVFSSLTMADRLAALVGLTQTKSIDANDNDEKNDNNTPQSDLLARLGLLTPSIQTQSLSISSLNAFNGSSGVTSDTKSCTSSSVDGSSLHFEDRKIDRDRAIAKFASVAGEDIVNSEHFKVEEEEEGTSSMNQENIEPSIDGDDGVEMNVDLSPEGIWNVMMGLLNDEMKPSTSKESMNEWMEERSIERAKDDNDPRVIEVMKRIEEAYKIEDSLMRHRKIAAEKMKLKRLKESDEERIKRLEKMRERYQNRRGGDGMKKEKREKKEEKEKRRSYGVISEEQRLKRNEKMKEYQRRKRFIAKQNKELLRTLVPDYEMMDASMLSSLIASQEESGSEGGVASSDPAHSEGAEPMASESPSGDEMIDEGVTNGGSSSSFEQLLQCLQKQTTTVQEY